jgi:hypothetical protein
LTISIHAKGGEIKVALLDLQGMQFSEEEWGGGGSRLSVTGCWGVSGISLTNCK